MKQKYDMYARTGAVIVAVRPAMQRTGTVHTYVLNGTLLRDVLAGGKWVTHHASISLESRAA
ncbi:hypothetical protein B0G80_9081 [Paraburkholderia sp. BL6669N2]|uniref:hypothetical protein n=1 Tax=Paraburkholderia sp. BL6669N2 TaxID=1938807 RepID=UPI000E253DE7|nr:hypothetical protein [Paraburkholderia sp. BL6669N2]REG45484.1 hypothetical protein B0G80_9081 [Paraburkholderia sp. BL6669N2]